jgi:hypothetical protein
MGLHQRQPFRDTDSSKKLNKVPGLLKIVTDAHEQVDFMVPYAVHNKPWPYPETTPYSYAALFDIYRRGALVWANATYEAWAQALPGGTNTDPARIAWPLPRSRTA